MKLLVILFVGSIIGTSVEAGPLQNEKSKLYYFSGYVGVVNPTANEKYTLYSQMVPWVSAKDQCINAGANSILARISSNAEAEQLMTWLRDNQDFSAEYWIDGRFVRSQTCDVNPNAGTCWALDTSPVSYLIPGGIPFSSTVGTPNLSSRLTLQKDDTSASGASFSFASNTNLRRYICQNF